MKTKTALTLSSREQQRLHVLNAVLAGRWSVEEAAAALNLSTRQVRRLKAAYQQEKWVHL